MTCYQKRIMRFYPPEMISFCELISSPLEARKCFTLTPIGAKQMVNFVAGTGGNRKKDSVHISCTKSSMVGQA